MVNYSIRSVYNKEYFELYSEKRNRSFRFAKYNGNNYEELCKYIHEVSPNTEIWEEYKMTKNSFYTYSGRTYQFNEVPLWEMRCCIVSNPFLLLDGERIPLTLSQSEAEEYLKLSDKNTVFCYDDLCVNYMYNSESCEYVLIDRNHPRGISSANLNNHQEWYIGIIDNIHELPNPCTPHYQFDIHIVHFEYGLREKADKIVSLIYEINKLAHITQDGKIIFKPSWEDFKRYKTLFLKCQKESHLKDFVQTLYNYIYEETKDYQKDQKNKITRMTLPPKFRSSKFVTMVGEFRNYYDHGISEYESNKESINQIFIKYLNINTPPKQVTDYERIQLGLLNDFELFLKTLYDSIGKNRKIVDYISTDDKGNVYCSNVLLPRDLFGFKGCRCQLSQIVNNNIIGLNKKYEYYCQFPDFIYFRREGVIEYDDQGFLKCHNILIPDDSLRLYLGKKAIVNKIFISNQKYRELGYNTVACELTIVVDPSINGEIEINNNVPSISSIELPKEWLAFSGFIGDIRNIRANSIFIGQKYELTPLINVKEGDVRKDKMGICYCGNVLLPPTAVNYLGKRVRLGKKEKNINSRHSFYQLYCNDFDLI